MHYSVQHYCCHLRQHRRITAILARENISVNHKRVQRLMREMDLYAIYPRPNTSIKNKEQVVMNAANNQL